MSDEQESCAIPARATASAPLPLPPVWIGFTLRAAGIYNLVWGTLVVLFPSQPFAWLGMEPPNYPELWQCIGMVVGVYGIGYWIAANDPARQWPIVLVGWLGKVLGPIGFLLAALAGDLPWSFGLVNVANDLIWWVPFTAMLFFAWRTNSAPTDNRPLSLHDALHNVPSQRGRTIAELSSPGVLVLFIRHAGCTFCREALAELARVRKELESQGLRLVVVHMSRVDTASALLERYGLGDVDHFSDPECRMFRALELARGSLWQVLGPAVWSRGLTALVKHGIGRIDGDGFQLGGVFLVRDGRIVAAERHRTSADRVDFAALAKAS
jgi:hypothetical protein